MSSLHNVFTAVCEHDGQRILTFVRYAGYYQTISVKGEYAMSSLVMERRAKQIMASRARKRVSTANTVMNEKHVRIVGYDDDGPVLDIPDTFVYHPKRSASGILILPREWAE